MVIDDALVVLRTENIRPSISKVVGRLAMHMRVDCLQIILRHRIIGHFAFLPVLDLSKVHDALLPVLLHPGFKVFGAILAHLDVMTSCDGFAAAPTGFALIFG